MISPERLKHIATVMDDEEFFEKLETDVKERYMLAFANTEDIEARQHIAAVFNVSRDAIVNLRALVTNYKD